MFMELSLRLLRQDFLNGQTSSIIFALFILLS